MRILFFVISLFFSASSVAQDIMEKENWTPILERVFETDQGVRKNYLDSVNKYSGNSKESSIAAKKMVKQDSINQRLVFSLLDNFGWPSNEEISENASIMFRNQSAHFSPSFKFLYPHSIADRGIITISLSSIA